MSEERRWRYRMSEEEEREIRVNALKRAIRDKISEWKRVLGSIANLGIERIISEKEEWVRLKKKVEDLANRAISENDEDILKGIREEVEDSIIIAERVIKEAYEEELNRQRKEEAFKKAVSSLEVLRLTIEGAYSNELLKKWVWKEFNQLINKLKEIESLLKEERYEEIPNQCEILKRKVSELLRISEEREREYLRSTSAKDKIVQVLYKLNFPIVLTREEKKDDVFCGYTIVAKGQLGKEIVTKVTNDGRVIDEFKGYPGEDCLQDADKYAEELIKTFGVSMEEVVENPPRKKPKPLEKIQKPLPKGRGREGS